MRPFARAAYPVVALVLVAGLVVQVFLAGLGVFDDPASFITHRDFGYTLEILPIILVILGAIAGLDRRLIGLAGLMFVLFLVQSILVALREQAPVVAALHPVNGFLVLLLAIAHGRLAWQATHEATVVSG
jgi:hypothetical protein